jgi:hypothetical protein
VFDRLGLHFVVCTTCALARSGIVKRVAGCVGVSGTPERKPRNAAGLGNSKSNACPKPPMVSGGFESGLLLQMLIDSSPTSQTSFSCTCSCQICALPVNILSRWVSRAAACVVQGPGDVRSARYWQKAWCGFEPRSLDSESRVLAVTPRGQFKLAAICAPTH